MTGKKSITKSNQSGLGAMIFGEDINSEVIFKHRLDLDRQVDRQKWLWKGIQGRDPRARE